MTETPQKSIQQLIKDGEYLSAYDLASQLLEQDPDNENLVYYSILSLARSGALTQAQTRYSQSKLASLDNEDYLSLGARLSKDSALSGPLADRKSGLEDAARQYEQIYHKTGGDYPAVNAATLYFLSGDLGKAHSLAEQVLDICKNQGKKQGLGEYYRLVTIAEANLVLGKTENIAELLLEATKHISDDWSARSITQKQLSLLLPEQTDRSLLQALNPPQVIHFCGHLISKDTSNSRFKPENEPVVRNTIIHELNRLNVGFGYGSLASGADILFAEALLERNAHLHVILPFNMEEFVDISVKPAGKEWVVRFENCIKQAKTITYATEDEYLNDDSLFHYTTRLAMGLAIQKCDDLNLSPIQIAVWDNKPPEGIAGTAADIYFWHEKKLPAILISSSTGELLPQPTDVKFISSESPPRSRHPMAMLFGDIKGFSKLTDRELLIFVEEVLGAISKALEPFENSIHSVNTWGDGIFIVLRDTIQAAEGGRTVRNGPDAP